MSCTKLTLHTVAAIDMKSMGLSKWLVYIQIASVHSTYTTTMMPPVLARKTRIAFFAAMREDIPSGFTTRCMQRLTNVRLHQHRFFCLSFQALAQHQPKLFNRVHNRVKITLKQNDCTYTQWSGYKTPGTHSTHNLLTVREYSV